MAFDLNSFKSWETICRGRVAEDPSDTGARLDLAWCLFLKGYCRAAGEPAPAEAAKEGGAREELRAVFAEAMCEALKACRIGSDPAHRAEAARLESLLRTLGEQEAVDQAHEKMGAIFRQLARAAAAPESPARYLPESVVLSKGSAPAGPLQKATSNKTTRKPGSSRPPGRPGA